MTTTNAKPDQAGSLKGKSRIAAIASAVFLFALNAILCRELFGMEFTERMESIESSYMSISRWAMDHWGSLDWFPLWFSGMPFHQVYQPAFHLTVAAVGTAAGWTAQHAYHFVTAMEYCLGPVTLFYLCYRVTGWVGYALATGTAYSLISPASILVPLVRHDAHNLITGRRFQVLVHYGEGPHTTAVMLIPLVLLAVHYAATERKRWAIIAAPVLLALLVLTNWPGTTGFCLALAAYVVSRFGAERRIHWPTMIGIAGIAYLLACRWIPPSIILLVKRNAQQSDATAMNSERLLALAGLAAGVLLLQWILARYRVNPWLCFFTHFTVITAVVSIAREWFGWHLLPQSNRFQVEFEMACVGLAAWLGVLLYRRLPRVARVAMLSIVVATFAYQAIRFRKFEKRLIPPIDITQTIEYRMAKWFDANMGGRKVFAPGNVSLWMNMFTDTPQMAGCCDQGIPVHLHRIANYVIYTGQNAGARDAEISTIWLKAYGVDAIGVTGPKSTEAFHPFWNASKFEGVLPVLWRSGDNAVYSVERRSRSLAHVIDPAELVTRTPENGLVVEPLIPYVRAIEAPAAPPADFRWLATNRASIRAKVKPGQLVSVQVSYHPGWKATANGAVRPVRADALGLMAIDSGCNGDCAIDLHWDGGAEARWTAMGLFAGVCLLGLWVMVSKSRRSPLQPE